ncbi:MAG TPA: hypothetical protein VKG45_14555 [Actinomycetes bacterium]|nr:hypothetical protein [Actinomycetes bacterium]
MTTTHEPAPTTLEELESVAPLYRARPGTARASWRSRVGVSAYRPDRRQLLRAAATMGTVAGLGALGLFPKAKEAAAACISRLENQIGGGCPVQVGNCSPACGPSTVYADVCGSNGYHKYTGDYRNRPDQCNTGENDGWIWFGAGCCSAQCGRRYRCHDGCKRVNGAWRNSICRVTLSGCLC